MKAIKIRLYPNRLQRQMLLQHFGCARFVYNRSLATKINAYKESKTSLSKFELVNQLVPLKEEFTFLKEVKAETLQNSLDGIETAYKSFFKGGGFPKFKKKSRGGAFTQKQNFKVLENTNKLVFLKHKIKFKCSVRDDQELRSNKIRRITYSVNPAGEFYASVLIDFQPESLEPNAYEVGIDLGLKEFLTTSEGEVVANPRFLKQSSEKLAKLQKSLSRKQKGSSNRNKARVKVAKQHQKIENQRNHFLHNVSKKLIHENQVIYLETLRVKNMVKNHKLAKSISDASWSRFVSMLEYKAAWAGRTVVKIGTFEPSSKTCSSCGWKKPDLTLKDRTFECNSCGLEIDRDLNAALNIKNIGRNYPESTLVETKPVGSRRSKKNRVEAI